MDNWAVCGVIVWVVLAIGYALGFLVGQQRSRNAFLDRILFPKPFRNLILGKIKSIGAAGPGYIELHGRDSVLNFFVGDDIIAKSPDGAERTAIARIKMRDRESVAIYVVVRSHPMADSNTEIAANPHDWQPGDLLYSYDPS